MVSRPLSESLLFAAPALASLAVAGASWWAKPGRVPRSGDEAEAGRAIAPRWIAVALAALISVAFGVEAYVDHAAEVSSGQALGGAVIALLATTVPLGVYWAMGLLTRRLEWLVVVWVASLVPLYVYALVALLLVISHTQCGPQAYECPL
jgi:hypothetical protein